MEIRSQVHSTPLLKRGRELFDREFRVYTRRGGGESGSLNFPLPLPSLPFSPFEPREEPFRRRKGGINSVLTGEHFQRRP